MDIIVRVEKARFAVLMPDTGERPREAIARLSRNSSSIKIKNLTSGEVNALGIRVGYSTFPEDAREPEELLLKASHMEPLL